VNLALKRRIELLLCVRSSDAEEVESWC